jgi:xanthine/CO dehydrogenase XdhC/CoxF family maturation factor
VEPVVTLARAVGWRVDVFRGHQMPDSSAYDAIVIMTHNFLRDIDVLQAVLAWAVPYVGLLGPKTRGQEILAELRVTPEMRQRLHNPIGLDLGGDSPEDIALAIIAEIQTVLNRRRADSLREKEGPIHESPLPLAGEGGPEPQAKGRVRVVD